MSFAYQKIAADKVATVLDSGSGSAKLMFNNSVSSSALRRNCARQCLKVGGNLTKEEQVCLTSCYHKNVHLPSLKTVLI